MPSRDPSTMIVNAGAGTQSLDAAAGVNSSTGQAVHGVGPDSPLNVPSGQAVAVPPERGSVCVANGQNAEARESARRNYLVLSVCA